MSPAVVYVLTQGLDIGSPVAAGLAARGARVAWLSDAAEPQAADIDPAVARWMPTSARAPRSSARSRRQQRRSARLPRW